MLVTRGLTVADVLRFARNPDEDVTEWLLGTYLVRVEDTRGDEVGLEDVPLADIMQPLVDVLASEREAAGKGRRRTRKR